MTPFVKDFKSLFRKIHDHTDSRFVFKFHGNYCREMGETMHCFAYKIVTKCGGGQKFAGEHAM